MLPSNPRPKRAAPTTGSGQNPQPRPRRAAKPSAAAPTATPQTQAPTQDQGRPAPDGANAQLNQTLAIALMASPFNPLPFSLAIPLGVTILVGANGKCHETRAQEIAPTAFMSSHATPPADSGSVAGPESAPALTPASDLLITQITCHEDLERVLPSLRLLLQECVNVDPSSSALCFLAPISDHDTDAYWRSLWPQISANPPLAALFVLTKRSSDGAPDLANVIGTVHLACSSKQTHDHKAEVLKLLISSTERGRGLGHLLMRHVETFARDTMDKSVLPLDTATGTPARAFYLKSGWTEWGVCPTYASYADGTLGDCSFFIKQLKPVASGR